MTNNPETLLPIYVALRAYQSFIDNQYTSNSTSISIHPGDINSTVESDVATLQKYARAYLDNIRTALGYGIDVVFPSDELETQIGNWITELVRYGGGEIHNVASLAGGMVSQEIIKVVTRQYVPVNNTAVFDGVNSKSQVWEL